MLKSKFKPLIPITVAVIVCVFIGFGFLGFFLATVGKLEPGEFCLSSLQCKLNSKCVYLRCSPSDSERGRDLLEIFNTAYKSTAYTALVFKYLWNIDIVYANSTYYYYGVGIGFLVKFDRNWTQLSIKSFYNPTYLKSVNNELFITTSDSFVKTDLSGNINKTYSNPEAEYCAIYYDKIADMFYVLSEVNAKIDLFNRELELINTIDLDKRTPNRIDGFSDMLFISSFNSFLIIKNKSVMKSVKTSCTGYIASILIDDYAHMAIPCYGTNQIFFYDTNGNLLSNTSTKLKAIKFLTFNTALNSCLAISEDSLYVIN